MLSRLHNALYRLSATECDRRTDGQTDIMRQHNSIYAEHRAV